MIGLLRRWRRCNISVPATARRLMLPCHYGGELHTESCPLTRHYLRLFKNGTLSIRRLRWPSVAAKSVTGAAQLAPEHFVALNDDWRGSSSFWFTVLRTAMAVSVCISRDIWVARPVDLSGHLARVSGTTRPRPPPGLRRHQAGGLTRGERAREACSRARHSAPSPLSLSHARGRQLRSLARWAAEPTLSYRRCGGSQRRGTRAASCAPTAGENRAT